MHPSTSIEISRSLCLEQRIKLQTDHGSSTGFLLWMLSSGAMKPAITLRVDNRLIFPTGIADSKWSRDWLPGV